VITSTSFSDGNTAALKFDEDVAERILTALRAGAYIETAANHAGLSRSGFYKWMKKGRAGEEPYATFVADVDQALATAELTDWAFIGKAREKEWTAAAWRLERRHPERYGRRTRVDSNVNVTATPFLDYSKYTPEQLRTLVELLRIGAPSPDDPALGTDGRPALELMPGEIVDGELLDETDGDE
jgi:hypothetical protein